MLTIEEAAEERYSREGMYDQGKMIDMSKVECFKEGAKFVQQWISVNDELPLEKVSVFTKSEIDSEIHYDVGFLFEGKFITRFSKVTHWRPIEFK